MDYYTPFLKFLRKCQVVAVQTKLFYHIYEKKKTHDQRIFISSYIIIIIAHTQALVRGTKYQHNA